MLVTPEAVARETIDAALLAAGWAVQDVSAINLWASQGVAVREFPLPGYGEADYLLFVDGQAVGAVEAKKEGDTVTGVEIQTAKYAEIVEDLRAALEEFELIAADLDRTAVAD